MKHYLKNSFFGILQVFFSMLIVFFSIPIFIHAYGINLYGVFSIISIFGNLTLLFNLGLNTTLLKFISENNDLTARNAHVSVSFILLAVITFFFSILFLLFQRQIIGDFFKIAPALQTDVIFSFRLFVIANIFIMLGQPIVALIQANNDYYKTSTVQWVFNVMNGLGIIIISKLSAPFSLVALPAFISSVVWFLILYYYAYTRYNLKLFRFSPDFKFNRIVQQQWSYSIQVYFISLLSFFNEPLLKVLVAKYLGSSAVGNFDIILRIKGQLISLLTKAFEPLSTIIAASKQKKQIRDIVHYSEQLAVLGFIPLSFVIWFFSGILLKMWLKDLTGQMIYNIKLSVIVFTFSMVVLPNFYYLVYHNRMKDCMIIQSGSIIISLFALYVGMHASHHTIIPPVLSICSGILGAFLINIYYQWKHLRSLIFDTSNIPLLVFFIIVSALFFSNRGNDSSVIQVFIIVLSIVVVFISAIKLIKKGALSFLT